jgi:hypothetical protein
MQIFQPLFIGPSKTSSMLVSNMKSYLSLPTSSKVCSWFQPHLRNIKSNASIRVDVYVMTLHLGDLWYCLCLMQIPPLMSNPGICHGSIILYYLCLPKSSKLCQRLQHYKNRSNEECYLSILLIWR